MSKITIDDEFKSLIPPPTDLELQGLEESLVKHGCRDALIAWNGILLDGHNRYEICERNGIKYSAAEIQLDDRDSAKEWIIANQLSRRNLQLYDRARLVLVRDTLYKAQAKERQRAGLMKGDEKPVPLRGDEREQSLDTNHRLAKEAGVGHYTIHRVRVIEAEATPETKGRLARGETTISKEYKKLRKPVNRATLAKNERIGVIRELAAQGYRANQISERVGVAEAHVRLLARESGVELPDAVIGKRRGIDASRIVSETVSQAAALTAGLDLLDSRMDQLDLSQVNSWVADLSATVSALNVLIRKLKRLNNGKENSREVQLAS